MSFASVAALLDALRQLSLLEPEQMQVIVRQLSGTFRDPRALAGELVRRGWLTPYQVNQLFQGRGRQLVLGSFVLLERLGEGGMGQVFKARHSKLGRIVALKVIRKERLGNPDIVHRFHREIEAAATLSHPNIVLAYDADEHEGTHFFAMEYVEGIDLAKYVKQRGPMPVERACDCIRQAALGLQHAFERGLVHRDIKPHNLLLVPQSGAIKVLDMGLARLRSESADSGSSTSLTEEGVVMGTPDYMAPEQAMDSRSADIRADLYSLGCTFYFLLAGRVPFSGGNVMEKLLRHQTERPRPVLEHRPDVPPAVAAIIHRLMAKRPADRFQTPAELVAALAAARTVGIAVAAVPAVVGGATTAAGHTPMPAVSGDTFADLRSDTAQAEGGESQTRRAAERRRLLLLSAVGGGVLLALVLMLVVLFRAGSKERNDPEGPSSPKRESSSAVAEKAWKDLLARSDSSADEAVRLRTDLLAFRLAHPDTHPAEAMEWLARLPSPLDRLTVMPLSAEQKLAGQPKELLAVIGDHRSWLGSEGAGLRPYVQHSSDGRWLACNAADGTIRLLNPDNLTVKAVLKAEEPQYAFDVRRDNKALAACGWNSIVLWDVSGEQPRQLRVLKGFPARIGAVSFSPDGNRLAISCGTEPPTVRLWDISGEPKERANLKGHTAGICKPAFSPDGKTLVTGSQDKTIRVWDLSGDEPKERAVLKNHTYWVVAVMFSPDGKLLASSGQHDCTVRLWDMTVAEPKELTGGPWLGEATNDVAFSPDGKRLACGFWGGQWKMWDISERQLKQLAHILDHIDIVWAVSFAPDGRTLATANDRGTLHRWNVQDMPPTQRFVSPGHGQRITGLAFTPDDRTLVSMAADRSARLWDLSEGLRQRASLLSQPGPVCGAVHPDGRTLVTGGNSDSLLFWDVAAGKERRTAPAQDGAVQAIAYSPDGATLATAGPAGALKFWEVQGGTLKRVEQLDQPINAVVFSPDGRTVAAAGVKGAVRLWRARDAGKPPVNCAGPEQNVQALAFSPDGKLLATAGKDGRVRLYDAARGTERSSFPGHEKEVRFLAFTPDNKYIISAGLDGQVIVRDLLNGKERQTLRSPLPIYAAALSGDGRHLAIGHIDGTIYLLRLG